MKLLDFNRDNGRNIVILEMENSEVSTICYYLESLLILNGKSEDRETMWQLRDYLHKVASDYSNNKK